MNKKIQVIGYVILLVLWFVGSQMLVANSIYFILGMEVYTDFYEKHRHLMNLCAEALCLSVILGIDYKYKQFEIKEWRLKLREVLAYIGLGILVYVVCIIVSTLLMPFFPGYEKIAEIFTGYEPILSFILIVVMAPILEEYIFRGKIQSLMGEEFNVPVAIVTQAVLFGSLHGFALQKVYATLMGLVFGAIKEKSNKLQCTIIMHMTVNFIGWVIGFYAIT